MQYLNEIGKRVEQLIRSGTTVSWSGASTRLLEEATELALEMGAETAMIYDCIGDTLHKEANKENIYPSEIFKRFMDDDKICEELGDTYLHLLYIIYITGFKVEEIERQVEKKLSTLEQLNDEDRLEFSSNGKFYRKKD